ncbi:hypothetical protein CJT58_07740 [Pseudomonas aeruginosa]|nr:hypothetical protein HMPREF2687_00410 [Pseudomonas aeruginosa]OHP46125.1 hypothetical protein HMPREF2583_00380 [Pseudomonas aeruginosa]PBY41081.1 hypothetical protein CJT58_07740 [Pseudomonas aeruginosa]PBZ06841.1 hypothetical protein CJT41_23730 [Pseudomonas aeruginosa]PCB24709.1 hypothetical protein CJT92_29810 [Pseudomonas aeruginosa]
MISISISLIQRLIADDNIRWITHYDVVTLPENFFESRGIFHLINVLISLIQQSTLDTLPLPLKSTAMQ